MTFMAKLRWNLEVNRDKSQALLITKKYNYNRTTLLPHCNSSYTYRSIFKLKIKFFFNFNISHIIGNGTDTNLWFDSWIQKTPIQNLLHGPLPRNDDNLNVSSILNQNSQNNLNHVWNLNQLPFPLPPSLTQKILNTTLPLASNDIKDSIFWNLTANGLFTTKSVYCWISSLNSNCLNSNSSSNEKRIWKTPCNTREQFFIWQVLHEGLPTFEGLFKRNITSSANCLLCNCNTETTIHILKRLPYNQTDLVQLPASK